MESDTPMIPKHQAETALVHMSMALRMVVIGFTVGFALMVAMAAIFVTAYTSRTKEWLATFSTMTGHA